MRVAVVVFPGSNCEQDAVYALRLLGAQGDLVWHRDADLSGCDGVVLPGGFAHGDYLRPGAIARFSPVMREVERLAREGRPVLGICNGFQVLCEAGLLPGALIANRDLAFICRFVPVRVADTGTVLTAAARDGQVLRIPLASYQGNYLAATTGPRVVLEYCQPDGSVTEAGNPNGSARNAAAVANRAGNVVGVMPHPERAVEKVLGSTDGRVLIEGFLASLRSPVALSS
ncbi:MAG: phosphoribosylformylglycinamidine synthase subunit PurQ [Acidimicrobiia bacterium]